MDNAFVHPGAIFKFAIVAFGGDRLVAGFVQDIASGGKIAIHLDPPDNFVGFGKVLEIGNFTTVKFTIFIFSDSGAFPNEKDIGIVHIFNGFNPN